jgi:hypothetical protein
VGVDVLYDLGLARHGDLAVGSLHLHVRSSIIVSHTVTQSLYYM